jgi:hypothetical protein
VSLREVSARQTLNKDMQRKEEVSAWGSRPSILGVEEKAAGDCGGNAAVGSAMKGEEKHERDKSVIGNLCDSNTAAIRGFGVGLDKQWLGYRLCVCGEPEAC